MRDAENPFEPPTAEELAAAARLRDRLEGRSGEPDSNVDGNLDDNVERTLAILAAESASASVDAADSVVAVLDEVAVRRLRRELVAEASRRRPRHALRAALQVAAALLVVVLLAVGRAPAPPSEALLTEREALAREAVARALTTAGLAAEETYGVSRSTLASLERARTAELFSTVDSERLSERVGLSSSRSAGSAGPAGSFSQDGMFGHSGASATPTPGGAS